MKKLNKSLTLFVAFTLLLGVTAFAASSNGFSDVKDSDWYAPYLEDVLPFASIGGAPHSKQTPQRTVLLPK